MSSLFGGAHAAYTPPPVITPPPVMPVPDDAKEKAKRMHRIQSAAAARGRQSTILSDNVGNADTLGG